MMNSMEALDKTSMSDPYNPTLDSIVFTVDEKEAIAAALLTSKPWDWAPGGAQGSAIASVKAKIRDIHMARHHGHCCYCRKNLNGGGPFVIDREHVLPKSKAAFKMFAYEMWNLGIACKRCNMQYKKNKVDFIVDKVNKITILQSSNYRFIHPNFDSYKEHIVISSVQYDNTTVVKYTKRGTAKGDYTYEYFNLKGLEIGSYDIAQGAKQFENLGAGASEAKALAATYQQ